MQDSPAKDRRLLTEDECDEIKDKGPAAQLEARIGLRAGALLQAYAGKLALPIEKIQQLLALRAPAKAVAPPHMPRKSQLDSLPIKKVTLAPKVEAPPVEPPKASTPKEAPRAEPPKPPPSPKSEEPTAETPAEKRYLTVAEAEQVRTQGLSTSARAVGLRKDYVVDAARQKVKLPEDKIQALLSLTPAQIVAHTKHSGFTTAARAAAKKAPKSTGSMTQSKKPAAQKKSPAPPRN